MTDLLLASNNPGKLRELRSFLPDDVIVKTLDELGLPSPDETGATIAENSAIKAVASAQASGLLTLGDDSGLEVMALDGRPGVRSARFAGEFATDQQNIDRLQSELLAVPGASREAALVCVLTLANPEGVLASASGRCLGQIGREQRGTNGFGYDLIFYLNDGRTMAELDPAEKNEISHRGQALRLILPSLLVAIGVHKFSTQGVGR